MRANVDKETCIGCQLCTSICPEVFEMDSDGKSKVKVESISDSHVDEAKEAEASCPVSAISIS